MENDKIIGNSELGTRYSLLVTRCHPVSGLDDIKQIFRCVVARNKIILMRQPNG